MEKSNEIDWYWSGLGLGYNYSDCTSEGYGYGLGSGYGCLYPNGHGTGLHGTELIRLNLTSLETFLLLILDADT